MLAFIIHTAAPICHIWAAMVPSTKCEIPSPASAYLTLLHLTLLALLAGDVEVNLGPQLWDATSPKQHNDVQKSKHKYKFVTFSIAGGADAGGGGNNTSIDNIEGITTCVFLTHAPLHKS